MKCTHCHQDIPVNMLFCPNCGTRVQAAPVTAPAEEKSEYRVVFERLKRMGAMMNAFVIKVDGVEMCRLHNGESREVRLTPGDHQVEAAIFLCKSTKFTLNVRKDRHIKLRYSTGKAMLLNPMVFSMVVAEDENGVRL